MVKFSLINLTHNQIIYKFLLCSLIQLFDVSMEEEVHVPLPRLIHMKMSFTTSISFHLMVLAANAFQKQLWRLHNLLQKQVCLCLLVLLWEIYNCFWYQKNEKEEWWGGKTSLLVLLVLVWEGYNRCWYQMEEKKRWGTREKLKLDSNKGKIGKKTTTWYV